MYLAKPNTWFDDGTEAKLIDDYSIDETCPVPNMGLFEGIKGGKIDQEICTFDDFNITTQ